MSSLQKRESGCTYAANSVGRFRGSLRVNILVGHLNYWEAIGEAREEYQNKLAREIIKYLEDHSLHDSGQYVDLSLFMVGKTTQRSWPTVMFVSKDKIVRRQACKMIETSGIMDSYPGFKLGNMPLEAEFKDFKPLTRGKSSRHLRPKVFTIPIIRKPVTEPTTSSANKSTTSSANKSTTSSSNKSTTSSSHVSVMTPKDGSNTGYRLFVYQEQDGYELEDSLTAGGVVFYRGEWMALTAYHSLSYHQQLETLAASSTTIELSEDGEESDECEIMGLSDFEEDDEIHQPGFVDVTSRGSMSPRSSNSEMLEHPSVSAAQPTWYKDASENYRTDGVFPSLVMKSDGVRRSASPDGVEMVWVGEVVVSSPDLDYRLISIDRAHKKLVDGLALPRQSFRCVSLDAFSKTVAAQPRGVAVIATSLHGGVVGGVLSGTSSFIRLPRGHTFQEVYTVTFDVPLVPGDCGCWVHDPVSGQLFGHVIAGSSTTGFAVIMPARAVFTHALQTLSAQERAIAMPLSTQEEPRVPLERHDLTAGVLAAEGELHQIIAIIASKSAFTFMHPIILDRLGWISFPLPETARPSCTIPGIGIVQARERARIFVYSRLMDPNPVRILYCYIPDRHYPLFDFILLESSVQSSASETPQGLVTYAKGNVVHKTP